MNKIFIHIGYPKSFSTTLQRDFFSQHPELLFGGVGINDNISYANFEIEWVFEVLLKYSNSNYWYENKINAKLILQNYIQNSVKDKIVFSSEYLSFKISPQEIDSREKMTRLKELFSDYDFEIIYIKRKPIDLIKSLYKEYIRLGYNLNYETFLEDVITFRDRNFLSDLNYKKKHNQLIDIFGKKNVHCVNFDSIANNPQQAINQIFSETLKIDNIRLPIFFQNQTLKEYQYRQLLDINNRYRRGISTSIFEPFEKHRNRTLFKDVEINFDNEEIFNHVIMKRKAIESLYNEVNFIDKKESLFSQKSLKLEMLLLKYL
mgnify:CR=1 FL=1